MSVVMALSITVCVLNTCPFEVAQYAAALLFGPVRTFQWACYFHLLSQPTRYSPRVVGRLLGYGNVVIAVAGDILPYALTQYVHKESLGLQRMAKRYFYITLALTILVSVFLYLPTQLQSSRVVWKAALC